MAKLQKETYISDILDRLSGLAYNVELRGSLNLLDLHVISEDFYVDLLNLIYGWKLRNANSLQQNAPGIDLVDDSNRILAQVTGTSTKGKIDHSLKEIPEKYTGYHFYFVPIVIDAKEQRKYKYNPPHKVVFNPKTDMLGIDLFWRQTGNDYHVQRMNLSSERRLTLNKNFFHFVNKICS